MELEREMSPAKVIETAQNKKKDKSVDL